MAVTMAEVAVLMLQAAEVILRQVVIQLAVLEVATVEMELKMIL